MSQKWQNEMITVGMKTNDKETFFSSQMSKALVQCYTMRNMRSIVYQAFKNTEFVFKLLVCNSHKNQRGTHLLTHTYT